MQLGSLPWQHLCPGDFYLQVVPHRECAPRLVLKCLSPDSRSVQELPVPADSYPFLFTVEWLNGVNKERRTGRLERCLLAAGEKVLSLPWPELVYPQFVHKDGFIVGQRCPTDLTPEALGTRSPGDGRHSGGENRESEGEYVHLLEVSPSLHQAPRILEPCSAQIQTMPTRKGYSKSRSRRHRAWLHHKSGCGENFALHKASKTQEPKMSTQESCTQGDCVDQQKGDPSLMLHQKPDSSQAAASQSPRQQEQTLNPPETETRSANFCAAAAEDTQLETAELLGPVQQGPSHAREGSNHNQSPSLTTPKRAAKGNRRKKKGAGRGAGGRPRQGADLVSNDAGTLTDPQAGGKVQACIGAREQDCGSKECNVSTGEKSVNTAECCVGTTDCNGTKERGGTVEERSFGPGEKGIGTSEPAVGSEDCGVGIGEVESLVKGSDMAPRERSISGEGLSLKAKEQVTAVSSGGPSVDQEELNTGIIDQGNSTEGCFRGDQAVTLGVEEGPFTKPPEKKESSVDGGEVVPSLAEVLSVVAEQAAEKTQDAPLPTMTHPGQAVDWELLRSGVFALTGKLISGCADGI